jgi:transcriptional regulator
MAESKLELLQGTLDMLILKTLSLGPMHGYAVIRRLHQVTNGELLVEEGSLYPALHRMARKGWIAAEWGISENNRRAKYYTLTSLGQRQLATEISLWERFNAAATHVLQMKPEGA